MRAAQCNLFSLLFASQLAHAELQLNLTPGVTSVSHDIYDLHMMILYICVAIGIIVFGAMFYAIIFHRKHKGNKPAQFHEHLSLELTWTIIPLIILVLMAIPATTVLINMNDTEKPDVTIKITGFQWKWKYDYLDNGLNFFSNLSTAPDQLYGKAPKNPFYLREVDHPLVVPVHKKIRFLFTSNDVIHSWWVPEIGVKRDAVPGFINESWARINRPGIYRGQCAELCGLNHAYMPIVVIALSEDGFNKWVAQQKGGPQVSAADINKKWALAELIQHGKQTYLSLCAACHKPDGTGLPPTFPNLKISPVANGPVAKHVQTVVFGVPGTAMQAFGKQLSPVDIAAVITYERNEISSKKGDLIQPADIVAAEGGTMPAPATSNALPASNATATPSATPVSNTSPAPTPTSATSPAKQTMESLMKRGEQIYSSTCAVCHKPDGAGMPPVYPALKGSPIVTGPINEHINRVMNGKPGTAMQAFKDQLNDDDLAAVITYERNAFENNKGDMVQPEEIKAMREKGLPSGPGQ